MPPIGRADIATESFRKSSCGRRAELLVERLGMFKPRLKVGWRRFHNKWCAVFFVVRATAHLRYEA